MQNFKPNKNLHVDLFLKINNFKEYQPNSIGSYSGKIITHKKTGEYFWLWLNDENCVNLISCFFNHDVKVFFESCKDLDLKWSPTDKMPSI